MTFLPIVERELRVAARLTSTYRNRSLTAGAVTTVALLTLFFGSLVSAPSIVGGAMFKVLSGLTLVFCLLEGTRKTADCLSEEKREGTLGLLFLTDLKGYDIVLGKLAGMSLSSFYGLLSILPVLALPLLLGGVMGGEFWRMVLALLNILFFSLCVGVFVSAVSREQQKAFGGTLLVTGLCCGLPLLGGSPLFAHASGLQAISPVYAFRTAFEGHYQGAIGGYWASIAIAQVAGWLLLIISSLVVPRSWQQQEAQTESRRWWRGWPAGWPVDPARRAQLRAETLDINPVLWLAAQQPGVRFGLFCFAGVAAVGAFVFYLAADRALVPYYLGGCLALNFVLKAWVAAQACRCNARARHNNALEMMLVTPLTSDQIINGQIQALGRLFLAPLFVILSIEVFGLMFGTAAARLTPGTNRGDEASMMVLVGMGYLTLFALDMVAVAWTGMWFGLTSKKESQAVTKTILYVLIAPYLSLATLFVMCPGVVLFFCSSIIWIFWAKGRLVTRFREQATLRESFSPPDAPLWTVPEFNPRRPPLPPIHG